jgi:hypothetical protein
MGRQLNEQSTARVYILYIIREQKWELQYIL